MFRFRGEITQRPTSSSDAICSPTSTALPSCAPTFLTAPQLLPCASGARRDLGSPRRGSPPRSPTLRSPRALRSGRARGWRGRAAAGEAPSGRELGPKEGSGSAAAKARPVGAPVRTHRPRAEFFETTAAEAEWEQLFALAGKEMSKPVAWTEL
ncbi:uncharacterized protein LOC118164672 isoform X2 [Oxyura jamaicensis]|uniref:uncharacterized protein LOC118164672 isoform X2 n=1 Tax=Oxyura jamaicensis TaxID=8884 RepID=UPI0015A6C728|nr:uncharacterized protein LOC118164672 isoform X2 [Oxyura jamaicensis]